MTVEQAPPHDEVHVWCGEPALLARGGRSLLTEEELARMERFVFARDRESFLATRVLVRTTLSRYRPVAPDAWRFEVNAYGRPEIAGRYSDLRFNLSNTRGLVVCAVTHDTDVGIDVERLSRAAPLDVADRFFAPVEVAALRALEPGEQGRRFFDYWTLKESYIKARGLGLALPLAGFAFHFDDARVPAIEIDPALGDHGSSWHFEQRLATADHLVSLCVRLRTPATPLRVRWQWA